MKANNHLVGRLTEMMAEKALAEKGYTIITKNFSNRFGEIDLIAKDRDTLVFVEVKAKTGTEFGNPEEMITKGKLSKIRHMATVYTNGKETLCRIDVVAIVLNPDNSLLRLTHYQNVY